MYVPHIPFDFKKFPNTKTPPNGGVFVFDYINYCAILQ